MKGGVLLAWALLAAPGPVEPAEAVTPLEGAARLERFFAALADRERTPATGRVRVTHLGDSHVAADLWTAPVRSGLQARFGDGGRGYVLPGRPWPSYWQAHLENGADGDWRVDGLGGGGLDDGHFGAGGCSVAAGDPGAAVYAGTLEGGDAARGFSILDIHFLRQPGGGCFEVQVDGERVGVVATRGPWPTPAFARFELAPGPHRVEIRPRLGRESRLLGLSMENEDGVVYDALGINGAQATRLLRTDPGSLALVFGRLRPTLVVLSYGTNELFERGLDPERYRAALDLVLRRVRAAAPAADCLLTGPTDVRVRRRPPELADMVIEAQRALAAVHGCAFWDARAAMGGPGSIRDWRRERLAQRDYVHLTRDGYQRLGEAFLAALLQAYDEWGEGTAVSGRRGGGDSRP